MKRIRYPFSALVGQDEMKLALLLNAVSPGIAGVLIRGEKGTAKSTAVRALQALLPELTVVQGCQFGCDPDDRTHLCEDCEQRLALEGALPGERRTVRLVELPLGATEDRVLGTLDLERAIKDGVRQFEPGLLAAAHRGILYIDEVNLLPDHLVDALLDAATTGMNVVEREGISFVHPAQFLLIGTMNPEEGDLRPQLLDRFGLSVEVRGLHDPQLRTEVVRRRIAFESEPAAFYQQWQEAEVALRMQVEAARCLLSQVVVPDAIIGLIAHICTHLHVEGLRADITIYKAAAALAALEGRTLVTEQDVERVAAMALPHRLPRQSFEQPELDTQELEQIIKEYQPPASGQNEPASVSPDTPSQPAHGSEESSEQGQNEQHRPGDQNGKEHPSFEAPEQVIAPGTPTALATLEQKRPRSSVSSLLKKEVVPVLKTARTALAQPLVSARGRVVGARRATKSLTALALAPTLRVAALQQKRRQSEYGTTHGFWLERWDLHEPVRQQKQGVLILFAVDASGSMAARKRMAAAKGAVLALLQRAYQERDQVGLLQFRGARATLLLPPTNSTNRACQSLAHLPTGGRTPLASGLRLARRTLQQVQKRDSQRKTMLVLVTDGRANVVDADIAHPHGLSPFEDALAAAHELRLANIPALVIDTEEGPVRMGLAQQLADALDARCVQLSTLEASPFTTAVQAALGRTRNSLKATECRKGSSWKRTERGN